MEEEYPCAEGCICNESALSAEATAESTETAAGANTDQLSFIC